MRHIPSSVIPIPSELAVNRLANAMGFLQAKLIEFHADETSLDSAPPDAMPALALGRELLLSIASGIQRGHYLLGRCANCDHVHLWDTRSAQRPASRCKR